MRKFVQNTDSSPRLWKSQKSAKRIVITSNVKRVTITPATVTKRDHRSAAAGASGRGMLGSVAECASTAFPGPIAATELHIGRGSPSALQEIRADATAGKRREEEERRKKERAQEKAQRRNPA